MKTCSNFSETKPISEFHSQMCRGFVYVYAQCKVCFRRYSRAHYVANRADYLARARAAREVYEPQIRQFMADYLRGQLPHAPRCPPVRLVEPGPVAQRIEQRPTKPSFGGSNPLGAARRGVTDRERVRSLRPVSPRGLAGLRPGWSVHATGQIALIAVGARSAQAKARSNAPGRAAGRRVGPAARAPGRTRRPGVPVWRARR